MKHLLQSAVSEIRDLRRRNEVLEAQVGIVEVFAAALGLKRDRGGMTPDVVRQLDNAIRELEDARPEGRVD